MYIREDNMPKCFKFEHICSYYSLCITFFKKYKQNMKAQQTTEQVPIKKKKKRRKKDGRLKKIKPRIKNQKTCDIPQ